VSKQATWFTPEGIEDLLPESAKKLEHYRRQLLDLFELHGYDLVLPPLAEFTDSLLTGKGQHLAVDTCRFTDQESGQMMGVRADMTPQVARIATNRMQGCDLLRLCYVGEVLKTRNNNAKGSRSPIAVVAELFGHAGVESDIEVIDLMLDAIGVLTDTPLTLSLGQVSVVDELMRFAELDADQQNTLVAILLRKALPEYQTFIASLALSDELKSAFDLLPTLIGPSEQVLSQAQALVSVVPALAEPLDRLNHVCAFLANRSQVAIHIDLSDLRGYQYHTGLIFSAYVDQCKWFPVARGGRYDEVGAAFGEKKAATGFSLDLRSALDWLPNGHAQKKIIFAPMQRDAAMNQAVKDLRAQGHIVKRFYQPSQMPNTGFVLKQMGATWEVVDIATQG